MLDNLAEWPHPHFKDKSPQKIGNFKGSTLCKVEKLDISLIIFYNVLRTLEFSSKKRLLCALDQQWLVSSDEHFFFTGKVSAQLENRAIGPQFSSNLLNNWIGLS